MIEILNTTMCDMVEGIFSNCAVMTDDGHGWFTQGKRSYSNPVFFENEFNSIDEAKLMMLMDFCNIEHHQISPGSVDTTLGKRDEFESALAANIRSRNKKPLGISIHCDAWEDKEDPGTQNSAHGFCVYYWEDGSKHSVEGKKMARYIADSIILSDQKHGHVIKPRHDNGIKGANFFILRETSGVWNLIESAFMTNDSDLKWLRDDQFRNHRALAILDGIYNYIKS